MVRRFCFSHFQPVLCLASLFTTIAITGGGLGWSQITSDRKADAPPAEATGARRCAVCHASEVEGYSRSAMAHSLRRAGDEPDGTVNANGAKITMHSLPTGFWQRWQDGSAQSDYRVDYVIGSGNHASGYLVNLGDGYIFQSPVAYYRSRQSYDLAPGFEHQQDPDFTRPISEECLLCHSGTALHVPATLNQYREPILADQAITCERCHGPSERHIENPVPGSIVNPAKLAPTARDSICEQCHLFGVARVPNPGKNLSDFVPGQRLEDTFTIYHNANPTGAFKVISQVEQLALSVCARQSGGRLWCGTCHDPHNKPAEPVQYYRGRCLTCHTAKFPASHPARDSNCLECHMPRRTASDGGHTAFTDHRIQRRPETLPDSSENVEIAAWRDPAPDLQIRNLGIAHIEVGLQRRSPTFIGQGYRELTEVQQQFANDSQFFKWIGEALLAAKQTSEAKIAFDRALQLDPKSAVIETKVAAAELQAGDKEGAIEHLQRAIALDPLDLPTSSTLMGLYQSEGRLGEASELASKIEGTMRQQHETTPAPEGALTLGVKNAGAVYKNLKVLSDAPAAQLIPAMQFISASLGVECNFCHVEGHFDKDDKKPKQIARQMMQMTLALDEGTFEGDRRVTCYSCHRGTTDPVATSELAVKMNAPSAANYDVQQTQSLPTVAQIIDHYIQAVGGAAALEQIISRVQVGIIQKHGESSRVEILTEAPNKQALVQHAANGDEATVFDGIAGWVAAPKRPVREMNDADIAGARMDADLRFPLHIRQMFPDLRIQYPETIAGRGAYLLLATQVGQPSMQLYFDKDSGLLVRVTRYSESPLGRVPLQIDYADYRDVDGVQVAFRLTYSRAGGSSIIQIDEVHQNVPIDAAHFAKLAPQ
jgi:photosynthetic reaction center cytochrome c subunit